MDGKEGTYVIRMSRRNSELRTRRVCRIRSMFSKKVVPTPCMISKRLRTINHSAEQKNKGREGSGGIKEETEGEEEV